ncbi:MAG: hypothetical protein EBW87_02675 [Burkholderiaceae bacterium]|nr:hypothetical protein [Burkholderiaceae bacterium]
MMYLVFDTLEAATIALNTIYKNMIFGVPYQDLMNVNSRQVVDKTTLTPEQAIEVHADDRNYPVFGVNAATQELDTQNGYTTAWAVPRQRVTDSKSVFPRPDDALMVGVTGFVEEQYDLDWFPPEVPV